MRLPATLVRELAEAVGLAQPDWVAAREQDDWDRFAPHLARIVDLKRREAAELGIGDEPYDALLDEYEPGARTAQLMPVFGDLRTALVDLLGRIDATAAPLPAGPYPVARQEMLSRDVLAAIGYDLAAGRLDVSAHPFTESPGPGDVRVTSRFAADDLLSGLTATLHEGGHALYEQGLPDHLAELPSGQAVSLGIHESQSLLWENHVGRSRPFCRWLAPRLREAFPTVLAGLDHDALHAALNTVRPGPIRIEADEVHYNLHIVLRLEIERALLAGDLAVNDVPAAWRERARDLLGLKIADHRTGALQDIHWCMGALGYFPTYTLGKLYAAMFWNAARRDLPDLDALRRRRVHAAAVVAADARPCPWQRAAGRRSLPRDHRTRAAGRRLRRLPRREVRRRRLRPPNPRIEPWPSARPAARRPRATRPRRSRPHAGRPPTGSRPSPSARLANRAEPPPRRVRVQRPGAMPARRTPPPRPRPAAPRAAVASIRRLSAPSPARSAARRASSTRPSWPARNPP